jgi:hypothetical protein
MRSRRVPTQLRLPRRYIPAPSGLRRSLTPRCIPMDGAGMLGFGETFGKYGLGWTKVRRTWVAFRSSITSINVTAVCVLRVAFLLRRQHCRHRHHRVGDELFL